MYSSRDELPFEGRLYPANEPTPPNPCRDSIRENDLVVLLGASAVRADRFPVSIINVGGEDRLVLDRVDDGSIAISLDILEEDGDVSIRITQGKFSIRPNNLHAHNRKDRNSLEITDPSGTQILTMRYVNKHVLVVDAVLRYHGLDGPPVIFSGSTSGPANIGKAGIQMRRDCFYNAGVALLSEMSTP